ncbi:DUF2690 domain-containing protein [Streptacidiphilus sp. PB12-B1b]|uniref:DUF2690 domain-containing protein n=1 Tax=Streptacidiphilus sp. PB12-B1b TaxID=2705012 RepID=UPI00351A99EE
MLHLQTPEQTGLEFRYSPLCHAAWARVWNSRLGDVLTLTVPGQPVQRVVLKDPDTLDAFVYTPLVALSGGTTSRACLAAASGRPECYTAPPAPPPS